TLSTALFASEEGTQLGAAGDAELGVGAGEVVVDGTRGQAQSHRDLPARVVRGQEYHLPFPGGEHTGGAAPLQQWGAGALAAGPRRGARSRVPLGAPAPPRLPVRATGQRHRLGGVQLVSERLERGTGLDERVAVAVGVPAGGGRQCAGEWGTGLG